MRWLILTLLPLLIAWDNVLEGTIYDRDVEGIPRAAWIDIGRVMTCVRANAVYTGSDELPTLSTEMHMVRQLMFESASLLRQGKILEGTSLIDVAVVELRLSSRVDCPPWILQR